MFDDFPMGGGWGYFHILGHFFNSKVSKLSVEVKSTVMSRKEAKVPIIGFGNLPDTYNEWVML